MMNWSVIPEEFIFEGMDKMEYNWIEADISGVKMVIEPTQTPGYGKVVRLLSPNPNDYLNPKFAPGSIVAMFNVQN